MTLQILLVEDDLDLAETIIQYCDIENIVCDHAANGIAGLELATNNPYQVLLLDINLPRMDGLELCKTLRANGIDIPVLMLTARDSLNDKLKGFDAGTDDYLIKPFELKEMIARVRTLARRRSGETQKLEIADLSLDLNKKQATRSGQVIKLSPTGWKMLELLMRKSPAVVSRQELEQAVWGDEPPDSNSLKVHMHKLRQAIDTDGEASLIETVPSLGFVIRKE